MCPHDKRLHISTYLMCVVWALAWMGSLNPFDEVDTITSHVFKVEETGLEKSCESPGAAAGAGIWGRTCQSLLWTTNPDPTRTSAHSVLLGTSAPEAACSL